MIDALDDFNDAETIDDFESIIGTTSYEYFDSDDEEPKELDF
jgi:hypothetical protein